MKRFRQLLLAAAAGAVVGVGYLGLQESWAQVVRDSIMFLVPTGTPIEGGIDFDTFLFTGRSVGKSDVGECSGGGRFHVQNGVVTPGPNSGGGATRVTGVIQLTGTEIAPGTRLHPLSVQGSCNGVDGMIYDVWIGTVIP